MPRIKSAIKRVKVTAKKTVRNNMVRSRVRTAVRKFRRTLVTTPAESLESLRSAISQIDKAATKGVLHRNTAARKKSRLTRAYNRAQG